MRSKAIWSYALAMGVCGAAWTLFEYFLALRTRNQNLGYVTSAGALAIPLVGYFLGLRAVRRERGGEMTFGQGMGAGLVMALIVGVGMGLFYAAYFALSDAGALAVEVARENLLPQGLPPEEAEARVEMWKSVYTPGMQAVSAFVGSVVFGALLSALFSFLLRTKKSE